MILYMLDYLFSAVSQLMLLQCQFLLKTVLWFIGMIIFIFFIATYEALLCLAQTLCYACQVHLMFIVTLYNEALLSHLMG